MLNLEEMADRRITGANYITSVNGMVHPNRIMDVHDFFIYFRWRMGNL